MSSLRRGGFMSGLPVSDFRRSRRATGARGRAIALMLTTYLVAGLLGGPAAAAAELELRNVKQPPPVPVSKVIGTALNKPDETASKNDPSDKARWPNPGVAVLDLSEGTDGPQEAEAGSLPWRWTLPGTPNGRNRRPNRCRCRCWTGQPRQPRASMACFSPFRATEKAGRAKVGVELDYSGFAGMYGGDWASRLTPTQGAGLHSWSPPAERTAGQVNRSRPPTTSRRGPCRPRSRSMSRP